MEVEVEELWNNTVTSMPITNPATGLDKIAFSWKILPATLPVGQTEENLEILKIKHFIIPLPFIYWSYVLTSCKLKGRAQNVEWANKDVENQKEEGDF